MDQPGRVANPARGQTMLVPSNHITIGAWVNSEMLGRNPPLYCVCVCVFSSYLFWTWLQSENVEMPMFSLLEGPQQSAPTAAALAAAAPAAEAMTGTHVFPDTAAPGASVERAARKLTLEESSAGAAPSDVAAEAFPLEVCYYNSSWPKHGSDSKSSSSSNSSCNGSSSSSSNDTTSNYGP